MTLLMDDDGFGNEYEKPLPGSTPGVVDVGEVWGAAVLVDEADDRSERPITPESSSSGGGSFWDVCKARVVEFPGALLDEFTYPVTVFLLVVCGFYIHAFAEFVPAGTYCYWLVVAGVCAMAIGGADMYFRPQLEEGE